LVIIDRGVRAAGGHDAAPDDHRIFSASDLTGFLACGHLPFLRAAARGELDTPGDGASLASR
jgi:hypothetical protein